MTVQQGRISALGESLKQWCARVKEFHHNSLNDDIAKGKTLTDKGPFQLLK